MEHIFRKAGIEDKSAIWEILQQAIRRRKEDGSRQWQDGYPNPEVIQEDIEKGAAFVMANEEEVLGYCAVSISDEPAYDDITGKWLTSGDYVVYHRVAISDKHLGKGLAKAMLKHIEAFAQSNHIPSVRADTNFDNPVMLNLLEKQGYTYCGEVFFRGGARKAYEKIIPPIGFFPLS